jgi:hypothetical protein
LRRNLLLAVLVATAWLSATPASAAPSVSSQGEGTSQDEDTPQAESSVPVSWSVQPAPSPGEPARANFVLEAEPGESLDDTLVVENLGDVDLVLGVYASDAFNTPTGGIDLLAAGERPVDLGSWIELDTSSITVPADGSVEVPFTVAVPDDAEPGDHAGGIVTSLRVAEEGPEGNRVDVERRLGTRVHLRVDGELTPELTFTELEADYSGSANPFAPGSMRLTYRVENTGNVRLRATRDARVSPSWGPEAVAEASDMAELLPGNSYELTQTVGGVWPGMSTRSEVELGAYEPTGQRVASTGASIGRISTTLVPWPQIVLAAVVVALLLTWWAARRRSRRRLRATVDAALEDALASRPPPPPPYRAPVQEHT